jgi:hypothetical protein
MAKSRSHSLQRMRPPDEREYLNTTRFLDGYLRICEGLQGNRLDLDHSMRASRSLRISAVKGAHRKTVFKIHDSVLATDMSQA